MKTVCEWLGVREKADWFKLMTRLSGSVGTLGSVLFETQSCNMVKECECKLAIAPI